MFERWFGSDLAGVKSLLTAVPEEGAYSIFVEDPSLSAYLVRPDGGSHFPVSGDLSFFEEALFTRVSMTPTASMTPTPSASPTLKFTRALIFPFGGRSLPIWRHLGWTFLWNLPTPRW
jgi:hypothetical protein